MRYSKTILKSTSCCLLLFFVLSCLLIESFSLEVLSTTSNSTSSSSSNKTDLNDISSKFAHLISSTFLPGGANLLTVDGTPTCCWLPPPNGWSTGFMATALTFGHLFLSLFILWKTLPALRIGLSILSPPAMSPIIALESPGRVFLVPDGSLTLVLL